MKVFIGAISYPLFLQEPDNTTGLQIGWPFVICSSNQCYFMLVLHWDMFFVFPGLSNMHVCLTREYVKGFMVLSVVY